MWSQAQQGTHHDGKLNNSNTQQQQRRALLGSTLKQWMQNMKCQTMLLGSVTKKELMDEPSDLQPDMLDWINRKKREVEDIKFGLSIDIYRKKRTSN